MGDSASFSLGYIIIAFLWLAAKNNMATLGGQASSYVIACATYLGETVSHLSKHILNVKIELLYMLDMCSVLDVHMNVLKLRFKVS